MEKIVRRLCSKVGCGDEATSTLTYVYADSMAVIGPLSPRPEPHSHDLCARHAERLSAPNGWTVLRYAPPLDAEGEGASPADRAASPAAPLAE